MERTNTKSAMLLLALQRKQHGVSQFETLPYGIAHLVLAMSLFRYSSSFLKARLFWAAEPRITS